ncbi:transposase [Reichenbachiella sp. 5M10]|uniref:transposase n=1 Tax=Reichenbachiella sp. 5M10 TaxID=1889772 RepID=UPI0035143D79
MEKLTPHLSKQFSNLFSSYTQALNKQLNRKGSLFMKNYKRKKVDDEVYLKKLIHYIHYNPVQAQLVINMEDWKFSSYQAIVSNSPTGILREEVIAHFDNLENFEYCHKHPPHLTGIE